MAATLMRVVLACPNLHEPPRGRPKRARSADHDQRLYTVVKLSLRALPASFLSFPLRTVSSASRPVPSASYPPLYASRVSSPFSCLFTHSHTHALARSCMRSHGSWNDYRYTRALEPRLVLRWDRYLDLTDQSSEAASVSQRTRPS